MMAGQVDHPQARPLPVTSRCPRRTVPQPHGACGATRTKDNPLHKNDIPDFRDAIFVQSHFQFSPVALFVCVRKISGYPLLETRSSAKVVFCFLLMFLAKKFVPVAIRNRVSTLSSRLLIERCAAFGFHIRHLLCLD